MDLFTIGLGADVLCSISLYILHKRYLSTTNILSHYHSLDEFYNNNVNISSLTEGGIETFREIGCDVIVSGEIISLNTNDSNKIFNDVILWSQSISEKISNSGGDILKPVSNWVKCSPAVVLRRSYWWLWTRKEIISVQNPIELDGLESVYEVVVDNYVKHGSTGLRAIDKMLFSGTPVSIRGWLTKDSLGRFQLSRDSQISGGAFQISSKTSVELSNEINPHKTLITVLSVTFKLSLGIAAVLALVIIIRRIRSRAEHQK